MKDNLFKSTSHQDGPDMNMHDDAFQMMDTGATGSRAAGRKSAAKKSAPKNKPASAKSSASKRTSSASASTAKSTAKKSTSSKSASASRASKPAAADNRTKAKAPQCGSMSSGDDTAEVIYYEETITFY